MKFTGEHEIPASREEVWAALNDPEALKASLPGAEEVTKISNDEFTATIKAKVGPVRATFKGRIKLSDMDPPNGYIITGEGSGGAAGFAKGSAKINLSDGEGVGTRLAYDVDAAIGGKLAQIGQRLIQGTAKKMSDDFFNNFASRFEDDSSPQEALAEAATVDAVQTDQPVEDDGKIFGLPRQQAMILAAAIVALLAIYAFAG